MSYKIIYFEGWVLVKGYVNGVYSCNGVFYIGGQIGWMKDQVFESYDFIGQMEQVLCNIFDIVEEVGGIVVDIVCLIWFVIDKKEYLVC